LQESSAIPPVPAPEIDDQPETGNGIESENGEILQTGYTALPLEDDGECSDSDNSLSVDAQNASECFDGKVNNSIDESTSSDQKTACLSAQDVQQIRSAMGRLYFIVLPVYQLRELNSTAC
jgi:hypothetical protein